MNRFAGHGLSAALGVALVVSLIGNAAALRPAVAVTAPPADPRLAKLADIEEIRALLVTYGQTLDDRKWDEYSQLFAHDGAWIGAFGEVRGPTAIHDAMVKAFATLPNEPGKRNFHVLTNFLINVDGDHASAWSRWMFMVTGADNRASPQYSGRYEDELVRENGRWRFHKRVVSADIPSGSK